MKNNSNQRRVIPALGLRSHFGEGGKAGIQSEPEDAGASGFRIKSGMTIPRQHHLAFQLQQLFRDKYHSPARNASKLSCVADGRWSPRMLADIARLKKDEPLDYVIGWAPFLKCRIDLSARPLIPRPETEFWTEKFIERVRHTPFAISHKPFRILDVFSGSGCIGIAILKHLPKSRVDFADIDPRVLRGIKISTRKNRIAPRRYSLVRSDVLNPIRNVASNGARNIRAVYDAVVANPPYIATAKRSRVQTSVLKYEPRKALFGGRDGLRFIRTLIKTAPKHLAQNGTLWIEHDPAQKKDIRKLLRARHYRDIQFHKDQYGRWRYVTAQGPE